MLLVCLRCVAGPGSVEVVISSVVRFVVVSLMVVAVAACVARDSPCHGARVASTLASYVVASGVVPWLCQMMLLYPLTLLMLMSP